VEVEADVADADEEVAGDVRGNVPGLPAIIRSQVERERERDRGSRKGGNYQDWPLCSNPSVFSPAPSCLSPYSPPAPTRPPPRSLSDSHMVHRRRQTEREIERDLYHAASPLVAYTLWLVFPC